MVAANHTKSLARIARWVAVALSLNGIMFYVMMFIFNRSFAESLAWWVGGTIVGGLIGRSQNRIAPGLILGGPAGLFLCFGFWMSVFGRLWVIWFGA